MVTSSACSTPTAKDHHWGKAETGERPMLIEPTELSLGPRCLDILHGPVLCPRILLFPDFCSGIFQRPDVYPCMMHAPDLCSDIMLGSHMLAGIFRGSDLCPCIFLGRPSLELLQQGFGWRLTDFGLALIRSFKSGSNFVARRRFACCRQQSPDVCG